ncbi:MAG: outer membrane beta-barrel protein [bacterium]|nr:outer membrane beta-barrel protein [bacterium]
MTRFATLFAGLMLIVCAVSPVSADVGFQGIKVGGGFLWNDEVKGPLDATGGGLHVSVDFQLSGPISLAPFYEFSRRNSITSTLFGGEFHYNIPVSDKAKFYVGPGFGAAKAGGSTEFHFNGVGGFKFDLNDRLGLFVQGKYAWAADDLVNGIAAHGGITFSVMK